MSEMLSFSIGESFQINHAAPLPSKASEGGNYQENPGGLFCSLNSIAQTCKLVAHEIKMVLRRVLTSQPATLTSIENNNPPE